MKKCYTMFVGENRLWRQLLPMVIMVFSVPLGFMIGMAASGDFASTEEDIRLIITLSSFMFMIMPMVMFGTAVNFNEPRSEALGGYKFAHSLPHSVEKFKKAKQFQMLALYAVLIFAYVLATVLLYFTIGNAELLLVVQSALMAMIGFAFFVALMSLSSKVLLFIGVTVDITVCQILNMTLGVMNMASPLVIAVQALCLLLLVPLGTKIYLRRVERSWLQ